jgi:hypothetical protein
MDVSDFWDKPSTQDRQIRRQSFDVFCDSLNEALGNNPLLFEFLEWL